MLCDSDHEFIINYIGGAFYDRDESLEEIVQELKDIGTSEAERALEIISFNKNSEEVISLMHTYLNFGPAFEQSKAAEWIIGLLRRVISDS